MKTCFPVLAFMLAVSTATPAGAIGAQEKESDSPRSAWLGTDSALRETIDRHANGYKSFMNRAKTELSFVSEAVKLAREAGFQELRDDSRLAPGARLYDVNRDRTLTLIVIGREDMRQGFRVVGAHIDSPRLEVKPRALYKGGEFALFQTNYHGGLKTYEWTNIPLALMGRIDKKDGTTIWISVGNEPEDPVFMIPDLSPHVDRALRERKNRDVIAHEELDPLVGHIPKENENPKEAIAAYIKSTYNVDREDFISAELALVPASPARDVGFDRGLMAIYGQDDRLSGYAALRAILGLESPPHTAMAFLVDNEEVGSVNNTGARSTYLVDLMSRLMYTKTGDAYREQWLRQALKATRVISSDVNPGLNPLWPSAWEPTNAPRVGHGVNIKLYGRGFNANSEYIAWMRNLLDEDQIPWQTATYKVGRARGGTIGFFMSDDNMEVIDIGVPVLSIHTPYSISSKVDVYYLYQAMLAFYSK